jgi:hypothetical protein
MCTRPIVLLALALGAAAVDINLNYLASLTRDFHNHFSSTFRSLVREHANPQDGALPNVANITSCGQCVRFVAKSVLEQSAGKMKKMCADATNSTHACKAEKVCALMAKHPDVTLGMMIEHVRPLSLATAYCYGKGACEQPKGISMTEIAMGEEPHEALLDSFDKVDWSEVEEEIELLMPGDKQFNEDVEVSDSSATCAEEKRTHEVSPRCMIMKMHRVMGSAVKKVEGMCAHVDKTNSPVMQKMCPWMAQHKEVAFGMLTAKVEPWKFAFGACFHRHGRRGHHGHHGHHQHNGWDHDGDHGHYEDNGWHHDGHHAHHEHHQWDHKGHHGYHERNEGDHGGHRAHHEHKWRDHDGHHGRPEHTGWDQDANEAVAPISV